MNYIRNIAITLLSSLCLLTACKKEDLGVICQMNTTNNASTGFQIRGDALECDSRVCVQNRATQSSSQSTQVGTDDDTATVTAGEEKSFGKCSEACTVDISASTSGENCEGDYVCRYGKATNPYKCCKFWQCSTDLAADSLNSDPLEDECQGVIAEDCPIF